MDGRYRHGHRPAGSGGIWGSHLITTWVAAQAKKKAAEDAAGATALGVIGMPSRLVLWSVVMLVALANADLLQSRVHNYKQMYVRRIVFGLGVTYQTSPDTIEAIPPIVREIIEAQPNARFDRGHFKAFGDFSLDFEFVYYVKVPDYAAYADTQQAINFAILRRFEADGIEFAYPTQTLFVEREAAAKPSRPAPGPALEPQKRR